MRELKVWNGRGLMIEGCFKHISVCAYSRADAVRIINEAAGWRAVNDREIKEYYSQCWGNTMINIPRERGVWLSEEKPPRRIWPAIPA